jgi:NAD+ synthase (glutamine-hydrolysing)
MPIVRNGIRYNCRVIFYNTQILLIRPKMCLANDGNYREMRWFTAWTLRNTVELVHLPSEIREIAGQATAPFGDGVIRTPDAVFGTESCEELFTPQSPHIALSLAGVEIFTNGSASHHEFQKLSTRIDVY